MAAVLACGPGALLGHGSAAALWGVAPPAHPADPAEVVGPRSVRRRAAGVRFRRTRLPLMEDRGRRWGVPVTSLARTLLDLAAYSPPREIERMWARADRRGLVTRDVLEAVIARCRSSRGAGPLLRLLVASSGPDLTRSEAEARFLAIVHEADLPRPRVHVVVLGREVDFLWPGPP